jgi:hypothetical protein
MRALKARERFLSFPKRLKKIFYGCAQPKSRCRFRYPIANWPSVKTCGTRYANESRSMSCLSSD